MSIRLPLRTADQLGTRSPRVLPFDQEQLEQSTPADGQQKAGEPCACVICDDSDRALRNLKQTCGTGTDLPINVERRSGRILREWRKCSSGTQDL